MNITEIEKSIIQIFSDHITYSYANPWGIINKYNSSGTGFCIEIQDYIHDHNKSERNRNKYVITNAHCVNNSTHITVKKRGMSQLFKMQIDAIIYECDLAILSIDTEFYKKTKEGKNITRIINLFWDDIPVLKLGGIPSKLEKVYVYGYPLGGYNISVTKGSVNRIQVIPYFNVVQGIAIQIDAPINFGNSGGPVLNNSGYVVGVAFSGEDDRFTQNMGYIIPTTLVRFVLGTLQENKRFTGLCTLGINIQKLNNITLREYYNLNSGYEGILVSGIEKLSPSDNLLKIGDVIIKINDISIFNDSTVSLRNVILDGDNFIRQTPEDSTLLQSDEIVPYSNIISLKKPGDIVKLSIIRNGKSKEIKIAVQPQRFLFPILEYQIKPSYYIVAGIVFIPLSSMVINEKRQNKERISHLITAINTMEISHDNEQIIILSQIFFTELTEDYPDENHILDSVNDNKIINLYELRKITQSELKKSEYIIFKFKTTSLEIILKCGDIKKYHKTILLENIGTEIDYIPSF